jgi:hypothetical protein
VFIQLKYPVYLLYMRSLVAPIEHKWLYLCLDFIFVWLSSVTNIVKIRVQFHVISVMFVHTFGFLLMYNTISVCFDFFEQQYALIGFCNSNMN